MTVVRGEALRVPAEEQPRSVVDLIHRSVVRWPDREAVRWKDRPPGAAASARAGWSSWTYRQLWDQVEAVSLGLRSLGIGAGDRIVILSRSRPEWLVADLASLALGAVTCPIYPGDPPARIGTIARRVRTRLAFVEGPQLLHRLRDALGAALPTQVVLFEAGEPGGKALITLSDLVGLGEDRSDASVHAWQTTWTSIQPTQVATIVHTIGEDGEPKGVVVAHGNVLHSFHAVTQAIPISSSDVVLSVLPLSHMFERGAGILVPLGVGAAVAFADRKIEHWAADMAEVRPTLMAAIPLFFERIEHRIRADLAAGGKFRQAAFNWATGLGRHRYADHLAGRSGGPWLRLRWWLARRTALAAIHAALGGRLRFFVSGGAPLAEETGIFFEAMGVTILEGYGLTETAPILTASHIASYRYGTVGEPVAGTELRIDPASGEILARGPQVMLGYLDDPQATAQVLDGQGWLHTGDRGEFDEAGRLRITGRIKNLLVLATGKKVAPAPIERALVESPYIAQAVLLGDRQDAPGVLLVPEVDALRQWAGLTDTDTGSVAELMGRAEVAELLQREIERLTADFGSYERPRRFALLARPLRTEAGDTISRGPLVREVVAASFPDQVAELFGRPANRERPAPLGRTHRSWDATAEVEPSA